MLCGREDGTRSARAYSPRSRPRKKRGNTRPIAALAAALFLSRRATRIQTVALAMLLAGALGNFIDRAWHGYVVDFLHVVHWPVFNVADIYLTVGGLVLLLFGGAFARVRGAEP